MNVNKTDLANFMDQHRLSLIVYIQVVSVQNYFWDWTIKIIGLVITSTLTEIFNTKCKRNSLLY